MMRKMGSVLLLIFFVHLLSRRSTELTRLLPRNPQR